MYSQTSIGDVFINQKGYALLPNLPIKLRQIAVNVKFYHKGGSQIPISGFLQSQIL